MKKQGQIAAEPTRRDLNMSNPLEFTAHYLAEGCKTNIVFTTDGKIFEATPKKARLYQLDMNSEIQYSGWSSEEIQMRFGSYKLWLIGAFKAHLHAALSNEQTLIVESNVHSPFINLSGVAR